MKKLLIIFLLPISVLAWDFTQERNSIPVYFDSVVCQVPWTTGYNYINPTFADIDGDNDFDLFIGSDWARVTFVKNDGDSITPNFLFISDSERGRILPSCSYFFSIDSPIDNPTATPNAGPIPTNQKFSVTMLRGIPNPEKIVMHIPFHIPTK